MLGLVIALSLGQSGEALTRFEFRGMTLRAPKAWPVTGEDESGREWASDDDRAQMAFSSFPVDPPRPARACVKQLIDAVETPPMLPDGGVAPKPSSSSYTTTTIAGQPAAKKLSTDFLGETPEERVEANKVTTTTIVGCNGKTKWLLTFSNRTSDGAKTGALLKRVIDSISYTK